MRAADLDPYIGLAYAPGRFDCVDLVRLVSRELFARQIDLPGGHPRGRKRLAMVHAVARQLARPIGIPADGDLVLMYDRGLPRPTHVGLYFHLHHEGWVLHVGEGIPFSCTHRVQDLPRFGAPIEGFYTWAK